MRMGKKFLKFVVTSRNAKGNEFHLDIYGWIYKSGILRIANPAYKVSECTLRNFFTGKCDMIDESKDSCSILRFTECDLMNGFEEIAVKAKFPGFDYWNIRDTTIDIYGKFSMKPGEWGKLTSVKFADKGKVSAIVCSTEFGTIAETCDRYEYYMPVNDYESRHVKTISKL